MAIINGNNSSQTINGTIQDDNIYAKDGDDYVDGWTGNDIIYGDSGNDYLLGWTGNDSIYGGSGNDTLKGEDGNDFLVGNGGQDYFDGGSGSDTVSYYYYSGTVNANLKTDKASFPGWSYSETLKSIENLAGGSGNDNIYGDDAANNLYGNAGNDYLDGWGGNDNLYGNSGNDTLLGYSGNDYLYGGYGNDSLKGESGNDYLSAGAGTDKLYGGSGKDTLVGGIGADDFIFNSKYEGIDIIKDFNWGEGDEIMIDKVGFGAISNNQFSYNSLTGALSFDASLTDGIAATTFAILDNKPAGFSTNLDITLV